ncbi:MAG: hypothetical protein WBB98_00115 [Xanthobacteraceae bacterium]
MFPRLPERAAAKLSEITDAARDLEAKVRTTQDRIRILVGDSASKSPEEAGAIRVEVDRLRRKMELEQGAARSAVDLVTGLRAWLDRVPAAHDLAVADPAPSTRKAGETHRQAVDRLRDHVVGLSLRRRAVFAALPPAEDLHPLADAFVDHKAREFPLRVHFVDGMVSFTTEGEPKAMATAAWLYPDAMKRRLRMEVDRARAASPAEVMSREKRAEELARIDAEILLAEREEEAIIVEGRETESAIIDRRRDASPAAILGVAVVPRPKPEPEITEAFIREKLPDGIAEAPPPGSAAGQRTRANRR